MPTRTQLAAALGATALAAVPAGVIASTYVVHPGDTLSDIALRHGTTVAALAGENHLDATTAPQPGTLLRIPDPTLGLPRYTAGTSDVEAYRLRSGEGVIDTARRFGVDPTALARTNGIGVNAQLAEHAELQVPGRLVRVNALLTHAAAEADADPRMVRAVAWLESQWRQDVVSPTGAVGLMQLEQFTGEWVSRHLASRRLDVRVALDNALAGSLLLQHLTALHDGDAAAALAAYYQGDASVREHGVFEDTLRYQRQVQRLMSQDG
ncbi:MAG TPA: transglycosylase SLT domain-containing protein [Dehalococcoidia bacterium]|nr:transglycosylase SLT domain-containing protein [Dehalococcoidia bacterium]